MSEPKTHITAGIIAGFIGFIWLIAILVKLLVLPAGAPVAGGETQILRGDEITLVLHEWGFNQFSTGGPIIEIEAGEEVKFIVRNEGSNVHALQIVTKDGQYVAGMLEDEVIDPGQEVVLTIKIDEPGEYFYICPVPGHADQGMSSTIRVLEV